MKRKRRSARGNDLPYGIESDAWGAISEILTHEEFDGFRMGLLIAQAWPGRFVGKPWDTMPDIYAFKVRHFRAGYEQFKRDHDSFCRVRQDEVET